MKTQSTKPIFLQLVEGGKFFFKFSKLLQKLDFKNFSLGVMYTFLVQVLTLVAALLPIKILLLLTPSYAMPEIMAELFDSKDQLIACLCFVMFLFMFLVYMFSRIATKITDEKVNEILDMSKAKIEKSKATKIIDTSMTIYSSSLFLGCCLILEFFVYRELMFILAAMLSICFIALLAEKYGKTPVLQKIDIPSRKLFNNVAYFLFIGSFLFIVYDVLVNEVSRSFIELILGLILIRQSSMLMAQICSLFVTHDKHEEIAQKLLTLTG